MRRALAIAATGLALLAGPVEGHEVRPGYLMLRQRDAESWDVLWKVPLNGDGSPIRFFVDLPSACRAIGEHTRSVTAGAMIERWRIACTGGLVGRTVLIRGLDASRTDVLVRMERLDGTTQVNRLTPDRPSVLVTAMESTLDVAGTYFALGVEHILLGVDHLLFVLALLILIRGWRRVVATVSAFTVAHSLTLAGATLGLVHLPQAPIEAAIALSIVFVAAEIVHAERDQRGMTERWPWVVAFTFGLLHGFGFAGALSEVGLPERAIPAALLCFNLGVEAGQLLFIAAVLGAHTAWRWLGIADRLQARPSARLSVRPSLVAAYCIGAVAAFWVLQRTIGFFRPT